MILILWFELTFIILLVFQWYVRTLDCILHTRVWASQRVATRVLSPFKFTTLQNSLQAPEISGPALHGSRHELQHGGLRAHPLPEDELLHHHLLPPLRPLRHRLLDKERVSILNPQTLEKCTWIISKFYHQNDYSSWELNYLFICWFPTLLRSTTVVVGVWYKFWTMAGYMRLGTDDERFGPNSYLWRKQTSQTFK